MTWLKSEYGSVANKIKGTKIYDNMQATILLYTLSTPGWGLTDNTCFPCDKSHVAYQMNRKVGHAYTMVIYTLDGLGE